VLSKSPNAAAGCLLLLFLLLFIVAVAVDACCYCCTAAVLLVPLPYANAAWQWHQRNAMNPDPKFKS
jgi:hypothetical protein